MLHSLQCPHPPTASSLCQGTLVAARLAGAGYLTNVQTGHHEFWSDGAVEQGGQNHGPAPYDLLLAALATCAAMTLRRSAHRLGWALHHVGVQVGHYVQLPAATGPRLERIEQRLELLGNLDAQQREFLRVVAANCPVALALEPGISITTLLS